MSARTAIFTCCDRGFLQGARAMLWSASRAYPAIPRYCLTSDTDRDAVDAALRDVAEVRTVPRLLNNVPLTRQMMAARVFGVTLPADLVVYMDSDVVVCRPGPDLFDVDGSEVRAVMDPAPEMFFNLWGGESYRDHFRARFPEKIGLHGINSGVFALRPARWGDLPELLEKAVDGVEWLSDRHFTDQPYFSAIVLPHARPLPFAYNAHFFFEIPIPRPVYNVHYTSSAKPWKPGFPRHERAWGYWLRYGMEPQPSRRRLLAADLWIAMNAPRCRLSRIKARTKHTAAPPIANPAYCTSARAANGTRTQRER